MVAPVRYEASLREEPVEADPDTRQPGREPGLPRPLGLGRRRGARRLRPQREPRGLRGAAQGTASTFAGKIVLVRYSNPYSYRGFKALTAERLGRGRDPHLLRPRGGRLQAGPGVPGRPLGTREPHPEGRHHLRLHRARRPADPGLALSSRGPPGEAGGGALAAEDRRPAALVEGREAPPREHGRPRRSEGLAGGPAVRVPPRRRPRPRPPQGEDGQPGRPELRGRGTNTGDGPARRVGDPRQPPRRVGVRRRRPVERHRLLDGPDAGPRRDGPLRSAAPAHPGVLLLGRRGSRAHGIHRVGRALRRRARDEGGRLSQRRLLGLGPRLPARRRRLSGPAGPRPRAGARGPRHAAAPFRRPARGGREGQGRSGRHRAAAPRTISSTCASAAARTTPCS